jgi:hypothetical protein
MSRNGSGVYNLPAGNPVIPNTTISTTWANNTLTDLATAITGSIASDGQTPITGALQMGSNKITGLAVGTAPTDAVALSQLNDPFITGNADIAGTLHVTGATTLDSTLSVGSNLTVTGNGTFSGNGNFNGTGNVKIAVGTTAQRPAIPLNGMVRYNTTTGLYESFNTYAQNSAIVTLTNTLLVAQATTSSAHGLATGDYVTVSGCTPAAYNGSFFITVTSETQFTYTMLTNPAGSATVIGTYTYGLWSAIGSGGGASGGRGNPIFYENDQTVTVSYTIPATKNAMSAGPITIDTGVTVTISTGSTWVIV